MQKRQKLLITFTFTILLTLSISGTVSADMTGAWNSAGGGVYTSTAGFIQVNASATTSPGGSWTAISTGTTNSNGTFFNNSSAANHQSLQSTFGGSGTLTFKFSENVTNPILNIDRIGGAVQQGGGGNYSTSANFTSPYPIVKLTGPSHFNVISNTFFRTPNQQTQGNQEANWNGSLGTAAGSIQFLGTFDSISLNWTSIGRSNTDQIEFIWELVSRSDLTVNKTGTPSSVNAGEELNYAMSVKNNGPSVAYDVAFTDTLPTALTNAEYSLNGSTWYAYATGQSIDLGTILVNQTVNFWIKGLVNATTPPGTITNTVNLFINGTPAGNATATNTVTSTSDLTVTKTGTPTTVNAGEELTYAMSVKNNGPSVAYDVAFTDTLPTALTNAEYSLDNIAWSAYTSGQSISLGDILVNQTVNFWIKGLVNAATLPGTITNTVNLFINGTPKGNATATNTVANNAALNITKTVDQTEYNVGDTVNYNIDVVNNGPSNAANVIVTDTLPVGLNYVSSTNGGIWDSINSIITWNVGNLAVNDHFTASVIATVLAPGGVTLTNTAEATWAYMDEPVNATQSIYIPAAALELTKTVNETDPFVGDTVIYTLIVQNHGPDTATAVNVTDTVTTGGLKFIGVESINYGTYNPDTGVWTIGNLPAYTTATLVLKYLVESAGTITNNANVISETWDPNLYPNEAQVTINAQEQPVPPVPPVPPSPDGKTIPMQPTGAPIGALILAVLLVFAGLLSTKKRN